MDTTIDRQREDVARPYPAKTSTIGLRFTDSGVQDDRAHYDVMPPSTSFRGIEGVRGFYQAISCGLEVGTISIKGTRHLEGGSR